MDAKIRQEIEEKAEQYEAAKNRIKERIEENVKIAMEKLEVTKNVLLDEVDAEFGENPFSKFLDDESHTEDDAKEIMKKGVPRDFGPDEESFKSLSKEIESLREWRSKPKPEHLIPKNVAVKEVKLDSIYVSWDAVEGAKNYLVEVDGDEVFWRSGTSSTFTKRGLLPDTEHTFRVRAVRGSSVSEWSDVLKVKTQKAPFISGMWKKCPDNVDKDRRYSVDVKNPRIATKIDDGSYCTIIGNIPLPLKKVTSWKIKILKSVYNGSGICIGIAPFSIGQNGCENFKKCGWYFYCYDSTLWSGPPHNYSYKAYGPRKGEGGYVHTGDSVGVVMDTTKGKLSFVLNGVNLGVAYKGVPLDKPLVPCVLLRYEDDSVELDTSEVKEYEVDSTIPAPPNITAKSGITWDSITLTWDAVEGASFYQIEVDGNRIWDVSTTNTFTKRGLHPETDHSFRVRAVRGSSVSEWSDAVKGRTQKKSFETSSWKECPDDVDEDRKYSVDVKNPRIATKDDDDFLCTIIGSASLPLNKVTSWSIKVLKSYNNNGGCIYIGVAPFDINQNIRKCNNCGWYFHCYWSQLCSGPPHNYRGEVYGPRKGNGQYVHTGESVGVVMDTTKGELSFAFDGVNLGVAFEGIPLNKPLVPCVLLRWEGDSVELDISEVKENVDSSINLSNITTESITWDSITLTWDAVEGASFYQVEVDGSKFWDASTANTFTKIGLLPDTEHSFRVRAVRRNSVSGWSDVVKGRTRWRFPETSVWKECPDNLDGNRKYSVDMKNPRIATNIGGNLCTIIGNTPLPLNTVTSWSIKILKSRDNGGGWILIGVAPSDINQNEIRNFNKCGWYFDCHDSALWSGPPHNYRGEVYGPRKGWGQYVHTGDSVGVVMDTSKGELSFALNGVNLGVACEGIPLDKPLVPCVILTYEGDSVELVI